MNWLEEQLKNWGHWLNYDATIGPDCPKCRSIEAHHLPELGEVYEEDSEVRIIPDVAAAERINRLMNKLDRIEQLALAVRYGGMPAVFRLPRMSDYTLKHAADNAERVLARYLEKAA